METINKSLANEILQMAKSDQAMRRKSLKDTTAWDSSVDEANQMRLMEIVYESGWPTIPKVGTEASYAAWLLVQHAPSLRFMERCLEIMKALPSGDINPANMAYLEDRVLMMRGKPQIYGTQFQGSGQEMRVWQIDDAEHVDERRASVGLEPFVIDEARLRKLYKIT